MKSHKFWGVVAAIVGFVLLVPEPVEAKSSRAEFRKSLRESIGKRRGNAAIRIAAKELRLAAQDQKGEAAAYARISNNILRRYLRPKQRSQAAASLVQALGVSYFRGPKRYNPEDAVFQAILTNLVRSLPAVQKNEQGVAPILSGLARLNRILRGSPEDLELLEALVRSAAGIVPEEPPVEEDDPEV